MEAFYNLECWRKIVLIGVPLIGLCCFIAFLPWKPDETNYFQECCKNLTCNLNSLCKYYLHNWLDKERLSRGLVNDCCYWHGRYNETVKPYCKEKCLYKNKS